MLVLCAEVDSDGVVRIPSIEVDEAASTASCYVRLDGLSPPLIGQKLNESGEWITATPQRWCSLSEFYKLFGVKKHAAIIQASKSDPMISVFIQTLTADNGGFLTDQETQEGVLYLVQARVLTIGEAENILLGIPYTAPIDEPKKASKRMSRFDFEMRFSTPSRIAVRNARKTNIILEDFWSLLEALGYCDIADPLTVQGVMYLVSLGIITSQEAQTVLDVNL